MNRFFQDLVSRFLHDYLGDCEILDQYQLKEMFGYDPAKNPQGRRAPVQKPDFVLRRNQQIVAIVDAKYRDLWEKSLPREMLYQLALYAIGRTEEERKAVILYPSLTSNAAEQAIDIREPGTGVPRAQVILRPVNLLELEQLLHRRDWQSECRKSVLARRFAFGEA
jgi:5-methylcytosine-specific restriction enzyme subunit McrC